MKQENNISTKIKIEEPPEGKACRRKGKEASKQHEGDLESTQSAGGIMGPPPSLPSKPAKKTPASKKPPV